MMPFVAILRLIRPWLWIKFYRVKQDRIGNQTMEFAVCQTELAHRFMPKTDKCRELIVFYAGVEENGKYVANKFLLKLIKREKMSARFSWLLTKFCNYLRDFHEVFGGGGFILSYPDAFLASESEFAFVKYPPLFRLRSSDVKKGEYELEKFFRCGRDAQIVTFFNRDSAYVESLKDIFGDNAKHAAYCHSNRNSSIRNLHEAMILMSKKYFCFRMGKFVLEPLGLKQDNLVDYATSEYRSDFLDIYIFAKSRFYIGDESGINIVPCIFRKSIGLINGQISECFAALYGGDTRKSLPRHLIGQTLIPQKYYSTKRDRLLNLSEIVALAASYENATLLMTSCDKYGFKLIKNTPQEILDLTLEVEKKANDEWEEDYDHFKREDEFWKIMGAPYKSKDRFLFPRIGNQYLKENEWLLQ
ncbi:MAG: TIGR04372 family glycosyltransferase [Holosporales bacterium]|jgi:putative glycosyltransferase (TIGR04372 family)|nr:TIGR04372 family glycosyltransferase [Holosporales bacterium]